MKYLSFLALLIILLAFGCNHSSNNGSNFTISGTVTNPGSVKKVYLFQADSAGLNVVDSTNVDNDGKFKFSRSSSFANLFDLKVGNVAIFDLIAKNGDDIDFSTNLADTAHAYTITGSDESGKIQEFNKINNVFNGQIKSLTGEYSAAVQKAGHENDSLLGVYRPRFQKILSAQTDAILKFANENKTSLAAFYAMMSITDPMKYEPQMVAYADDIKGKFTDNPAVQRFEKQMAEVAPVTVGHKAPDFTTTGIDGKPVKLDDYKGKYVLIDFWASWCEPCRQENPNVVKLYKQYKDKGLNILGISLDVDKNAWQQAIKQDKLTWSHASDLKRFDGPTELLYHIQAIPSNFIIDPQGSIVAKNIMGSDLEEFLNKTFNKAQP
ncbi:MAG: AhpC/TSA family protein [Bacteroidetes bacterium]|nr:AhpC/TSA family protein [Bacteroidota bacterium]